MMHIFKRIVWRLIFRYTYEKINRIKYLTPLYRINYPVQTNVLFMFEMLAKFGWLKSRIIYG